jgi:PAS domain S-box-containing protein
MDSALRILMLEDTPADAELAERALRKAGIIFESERVDTRLDFVYALENFRPDVVLSDYKLPDFDGMEALKIVRRDYPQVPVIMVTGAFSDVDAVELLSAGAKDYILKDRLARLAPAVLHVVSAEQGIRARKVAERALSESEAKFRSMVESTSDWLWEMNEQAVYTYSSPQIFQLLGYTPEEVVGKTPFDLMQPEAVGQVREKFNALVREKKPLQLFGNANLHKDGSLVYVETNGVPVIDAQGRCCGYRGIDRDITERKVAEKQRAADAARLEKSLLQTIEAIASIVEARDPYTAGHQRRVAMLARAIAQEMGCSEDEIRGLYLAATIHDLGKISIPAEILSKPKKLTAIEYELIKTHVQNGYDILKDVDFPWPLAQIVLQHHERMDGSGYPQGLKSEQIILQARILAVADVVEAISSHRPYRPGLGMDVALAEILNYNGVLFDSAVVDACTRLFRELGFAFA